MVVAFAETAVCLHLGACYRTPDGQYYSEALHYGMSGSHIMVSASEIIIKLLLVDSSSNMLQVQIFDFSLCLKNV